MAGPLGWDAHAYESVAEAQFRWGLQVLGRRAWRGDEVVLDAGCGPGRHAEEILRRSPRGRVYAVDLDPTMARSARDRLAPYGPRAVVHRADLVGLALPEPVDVVFSNAVLHWVRDHDAAFATFRRLLAPSGELLLQAGGAGNLDRVRSAAARVAARPPFSPHFARWTNPWRYETPEATRKRLLRAGFARAEVSLDPEPVRFEDDAALRAFLQAVVLNPYLRRLPASHQLGFIDRYVAEAGRDGEARTLDYVRLNVRAWNAGHPSPSAVYPSGTGAQ